MSFNGTARESRSEQNNRQAWEMLGLSIEEVYAGRQEAMKEALKKLARPAVAEDTEINYVGMGLMQGDLELFKVQ